MSNSTEYVREKYNFEPDLVTDKWAKNASVIVICLSSYTCENELFFEIITEKITWSAKKNS